MQNRIVEIVSEGTYISIERGFLSVKVDDEKLGKIAIDDIGGLVIRGYGATLSANALSRLADANIPVVICETSQTPASIVWPVSGHFAQGLHMQAQAIANKPLLKRLWQQIVRAKISAQAEVLGAWGVNCNDLREMTKRVRSGDGENHEAQAARRYWPRLMGSSFRRDRTVGDANAALNYGYTILRAAVARSILCAGLHPSLSINHQSRGDALRLADDLMEPFRPWFDYTVRRLFPDPCDSDNTLSGEHKAQLASVLQMDFQGPQGASPMQVCLDRMAQSLVQVFLGNDRKLELPGPPLPLSLSSAVSL